MYAKFIEPPGNNWFRKVSYIIIVEITILKRKWIPPQFLGAIFGKETSSNYLDALLHWTRYGTPRFNVNIIITRYNINARYN